MKLKISRFLGTMAVLCLYISGVKAQSTTNTQYFLPEPFPRSPTSTAFEKYGTYKVNEFTGVPDISIPLYTIDAGSFKIPITLSYHASGNKVSDVASWVGLGWSLSAGGQISRRVMGTPDDDDFGYLNGYNHPDSQLNSHTADGVQYLQYASDGTYDTKPDIYSYDFPGYGGKFFFDGSPGSNFTPRFISYSPLKLTHNGPMYPYTYFYGPGMGLVNFTITDDHGNLFNFGGTGSMETTTSSYAGVSGKTAVSTWKLSSMISQNRRDTVSFSYQADTVFYPSADAEIYTVVDNLLPIGTTPYSNASYGQAPSTPGIINRTSEELNQQINFKNGKVVFEWASAKRTDITGGGHTLKDVQVWKYNYGTRQMELQKTVMFYTSYFYSGGSYRLRLDSIQIQDKAGSELQHYRFGYNMAVALPSYTSYAQDLLGYYNGCEGKPGKPTNTMLTPTQTITYNNNNGTMNYETIGQANRLPDSTYMQAFMLDTIHYPTGGYSIFSYQTNHFVTSGVDSLGEGLRIHTISSYDGVNPIPIVKTYVYNTSRKNYFSPYAYFSATQQHRHYSPSHGTGIPVQDGTETIRSYTSNPHCDLEPFDAAYVVYPSVTEYIGTPGNNIGRTDYLFTDKKDQTSTASSSGTGICLSFYFDRGHLVSRKDYLRKSDGTYQIVKADTNGYAAFPQHYYEAGLAVSRTWYNDGAEGMPINPGGGNPDDSNAFGWTRYEIYSQDSQLTGTISTVYDPNDSTKFTTSSTQYIYDDTTHMQVIRTIHTDSKGDTHVTANKYPYNYASGNAVIDSMVSRHMYAEVIEKYDTLKNAATGVNAITGGQINKFQYGYIPFSIVPSTISVLRVGQPLTNFVPSSVSSGNLNNDSRYVQMISFDQYDQQNNPAQYTPRNANTTSILWNYQYENPVAQIKNATLSQFAYTSFEGDNRSIWYYTGIPMFNNTAPSGSMVYPLSSGDVKLNPNISFDYSKTYILSYWSNNGPATIYAGGFLTSNPLTSANGWTYYECTVSPGFSSVDISGSTTIDELRLYPANAQMTTYAYDPSGVRTISDTKGQNNYFEYDFAQRLKSSKDYLGNIIANYSYHTYDQTVANQAQSATLTRNNCPPNTAPTSLTYSVPANKYYSSTLASANAEALYDVQVNGQAKANTNCGCPQIMVNVTLSNTSGYTSYQVTFAGLPPYNMPASGTTVVQVPQGSYSTVSISASSQVHTFAIGAYSPITGHSASVGPVSVTSGQNLTISIY